MRLTLRTLLAYLDDTLPAAETKEIGHKVAENAAIQELITRIKQVTRRRRLTTPDMASTPEAKVDANEVAEYLDNLLPGEKNKAFEELCLESDVNLAEVAACHQILTVILGEPAQVPPTAYQRMYTVAKGREAIVSRRGPAPRREAVAHDSRHDESDNALLMGLPAYERATPGWRRWLPVGIAAAVVLTLIPLAYLVFGPDQDRSRLAIQQPDTTDPSRSVMPPVKDDAKPAEKAPITPTPAPSASRPMDLWAGWVAMASSEGGDQPGLNVASVPLWAGWVAARPQMPVNLFLLFADGEETVPPPAAPGPNPGLAPIRPPNLSQEIGATYQPVAPRESILLHRVAEQDWRLVPADANLRTGELLLAAPGSRCEILTDSKVRLVLVGNIPSTPVDYMREAVVALYANKDVDLDLGIDRGRIILANKPNGKAVVRVRFLDQVWDLRFLEPNSEVGIEITGRVPPGTGDWIPSFKLGLITANGAIELARGTQKETVPANKQVYWLTKSAEQGPVAPVDIEAAPDWLGRKSIYVDEVRQSLASCQDRLARKPNVADAKTTWVRDACFESLGEKRRWDRTIGIITLGAIDEIDYVVRSMDDEENPDVCFMALSTLGHFIGRRPDQDQVLKAILVNRNVTPDDANLFLQMLRGFDHNNRTIVETLLPKLNHPRLSMRMMAMGQLVALFQNEKIVPNYSPLAPADIRERAIEAARAKLLPK